MPAAQTPPIPMPKSARSVKSIRYDVEKPLRHANAEYQRIENTNGPLRPQRSAAEPAAAPPSSRNMSVTVASAPASALLIVKLC